jgi:hypothetical protein
MFINGELTLKSVQCVKYDINIKCNQLINTMLVIIHLR